MDLSPYINNLREDLSATASAGDENTRRAAAVLSAALEPAVRLALMNALSDLAAEVTTQLPDQVVEVRLDGRDVRVVVTGTGTGEREGGPVPPPPPPPPPAPEGDNNIARMTLRLVEQIKGQAEQAAAAQGVSLNTFISQAVQGALHGTSHLRGESQSKPARGERSDSHLRGWVRG
ncbi:MULTISPECIES: toxin-antitoxin system HicB family antitoxin [Amycolatopsis]|uniref:HicB family protein n=2 Tax=Amycolatopsis TaxID=1813 RepID=A0A1I4CUI2_9PSEU|nr:toxin-antitoxin system HicB family antitoxin [Amycolatopsis sacchari]SFK84958.1 HicB family protein [Amycolatopsis sacchari]